MAGRQSEPSIDEILSSIRKVIAEDDGMGILPKKHKPTADLPPHNNGERSAQPLSEDVLELTNENDANDSDSNDGDALVNQETAQGLRQSLSTLAALSEPSARPQIVRSGETSLEGLVSEMLRPMMKEWLDQNLPILVETMVAKEIQRITKKG